MIVSKLFIEKFGFAIPRAHYHPSEHTYPVVHIVLLNIPVASYMHLFCKSPLKS
jgi:hypothetical protein